MEEGKQAVGGGRKKKNPHLKRLSAGQGKRKVPEEMGEWGCDL